MMVSIVIPVFNRKKFLEEMISSVLEQTYQNWELILIDDGSTDGSLELMHEFENNDNRIKVFKRDSLPKGAPHCRNIGLNQAIGEYIIFFDSDDLLPVFCLKQRVDFMKDHKDIDFAIFPLLKFNDSDYNKETGEILFKNTITGIELSDNSLLDFFQGFSPQLISSNIYKRKSLINKNIYWDNRLLVYQDLDFNIQTLVNKLNCGYANGAPDYYLRFHEQGSISTDLRNKEKLESTMYLIDKMIQLIKYLDVSGRKISSVYGFVLYYYYIIRKHRSLTYEYIKFCNNHFPKTFNYRLKIIDTLPNNINILSILTKYILFPSLFFKRIRISRIKKKKLAILKDLRFKKVK